MYPSYTYKFQFNNDVASCVALQSMLSGGWTVRELVKEDGYTWFLLQYEH